MTLASVLVYQFTGRGPYKTSIPNGTTPGTIHGTARMGLFDIVVAEEPVLMEVLSLGALNGVFISNTNAPRAIVGSTVMHLLMKAKRLGEVIVGPC